MIDRPDIVLIVSDQHNAGVMGCAGDGVARTPNLDALAARSARFSAAYCPYPLCVPSRMGLMAGRYPSEIDVWDNPSVLSSDIPTFAHALGAGGYETVLCGRMHFNGPDQLHGFERRILGDVEQAVTREIIGMGCDRTNGQTRYAVAMSGHGRCGYAAYDEEVARRAAEFLRSRPRDAERPLCLVVGFIQPHNPLICEKELFDYYYEALERPGPMDEDESARMHPAVRAWRTRRGADLLTAEQHHRGRAAYYGLVEQLDRQIGRVLAAAEGRDAVAIYTSDHGDMIGERGMWWKSSHFDGSARVPLMVAHPGTPAGGCDVGAVVSLVDIAPTLTDLGGAPGIPRASGRSLASFLTGGSPDDWAGEIFCEYIGAHGDAPSCMVRAGRWKLIYYSESDSCQCFDMENDPGERDDRAADPGCRATVERLRARIASRWSAETMLRGFEYEMARRRLIRESPAPSLAPVCEIDSFIPAPQDNVFDPGQAPA